MMRQLHKRKNFLLGIGLGLALLLAGCSAGEEPDAGLLDSKSQTEGLEEMFAQEEGQLEEARQPEQEESGQPQEGSGPVSWDQVLGTFCGENYTPQAYPVLEVAALPDDSLLFALYSQAGEESPALTGVAGRLEDGGLCYQPQQPGELEELRFALSEGALSLSVKGELEFPAQGLYRFQGDQLTSREGLACTLLTVLSEPPQGDLEAEEELVDQWFYRVNGEDSSYYVAKDYSSIYLLTDSYPQLLWGNASSMVTSGSSQPNGEEEEEAPIRYIQALPEEAVIAPGASTPVKVTVAGGLAWEGEFVSSDPDIAAVSPQGVITGVEEGVATISGAISVDGARQEFSFGVVIQQIEEDPAT